MKFILWSLLMLSNSASAETVSFTCPAKSSVQFICQAAPETAKSDKVKNFVKTVLTCYSSATKKSSVVIQSPSGDVVIFSRVETYPDATYKTKTQYPFFISRDEAANGSIHASLEIDTSWDDNNAIFTYLHPGNEMMMFCKKPLK